MQYANVMVAIGGNRDHTVPKFVSAAEIPVLLAIHGPDAVFDVDPIRGAPKNPDGSPMDLEAMGRSTEREELEYLRRTYDRARDEDRNRLIDLVYAVAPGTKLVTTLKATELTENHYKAKSRASADDADAEVVVRPPDAPGTGHVVPERTDRSRDGDAMLPSKPPGELSRIVDTAALGKADAEPEDFIKS